METILLFLSLFGLSVSAVIKDEQLGSKSLLPVFRNGESFPGCGNASELIGKGSQPWHAALVNASGLFCGGTLISKTVVLTAAHCMVEIDGRVKLPSDLEIILGMQKQSEIFNFTHLGDRQDFAVSNIIVHPDYARPNLDHDAALIFLKEPGARFTWFVRPICLWKDDFPFEHIHNKSGTVVGWSLTENRTTSNVLQFLQLRIVPHDECLQMNTTIFSQHLKPGQNFCAGGNGKSACIGDSGGGFSVNLEGKWYLKGIVSFGWTDTIDINGKMRRGCPGKIPSLFLDVTHYMQWIVHNAQL